MSGTKRPSFAIQAWGAESPTAAQRPSWMLRKRASTPPPPVVPPVLPPGPSTTDPEPASETVAVAAPEAPPPEVDLGLAAELSRLREENAALTAQVAAGAARLARLRREVLEASEPELVRLAVAVAERVVGRELALDPVLVVTWARDAIQALASKDEVVIAIARDVGGHVPAEAWSQVEVKHKVEVDPLLAPGVVEVRTSEGTIAAGGQARLDAVAQAVGVAEP